MSNTNENATRIDEVIALIIETENLKKSIESLKTKVDTFEKHVEAIGKEIEELKNDMSNFFAKIEEKKEERESLLSRAYALHDKGYKVTIQDDNGNLWEVEYLASLDYLPCYFGFPVMLEIVDKVHNTKITVR